MIKKITINLIIFAIFLVPFFVHSQTVEPPSSGVTGSIPNPTTAGDDIMSVLYALLSNVVMPIAAVAVVIWIIWAGFSYLTAQGNPAKIEIAHKRLLWSLIGAGILLGAAGISEVVKRTIEGLLS